MSEPHLVRPTAFILGCGAVGNLAAARFRQLGLAYRWHAPSASCWRRSRRHVAGDAATARTWHRLRRWFGNRRLQLVVLAATPGLRRAKVDNGLLSAVRLLSQTWPEVPVVYISSTAVYADLHGQIGDETALLTSAGRSPALLAIEAAVQAYPANHAILRAGGLRGGDRHLRLETMRQRPVPITGPLHRFLPLIHEKIWLPWWRTWGRPWLKTCGARNTQRRSARTLAGSAVFHGAGPFARVSAPAVFAAGCSGG